MSEKISRDSVHPAVEGSRPRGHDLSDYGLGAPSTQQMRIVARRRRDAEEKLEHHLEEARRKYDPQST